MAGIEKGAGATRRGAVLIVSGMAIIGLIDIFVVEIGATGGLWQFHAMRAAMAVPCLIVIAIMTGVSLRPVNPGGVAVRTLFFSGSMVLYFASLPAMPIALVVAGLFTSPVFVLLISALVFGERIGPRRILAVAIGFLGALLILNPLGADFDPAFLVPVLAGFFYALNAITTRRYCEGEATLTLLTWFFAALGLIGLVGASLMTGTLDAPFHARGWIWPSPTFLFWTAVQAFGSMLAVFMTTRAYQIAAPSYLAVFEYTLLIFASLWAWAVYGQLVAGQAMLGMLLVAISGTIIALRSR